MPRKDQAALCRAGAGPKAANRIGSGGEEKSSTWRKFGDSDSRKRSQRWREGSASSRIPNTGACVDSRNDAPSFGTEPCHEIEDAGARMLNLANPGHKLAVTHRPDTGRGIAARAQDIFSIGAE